MYHRMTDTLLHTLSVPFAIVAGTGAGVLALLSWEIFRESPFGTVIGLVSLVMSTITIYHVVLITIGPESLFLQALRSTAYTIIAIFILLAINGHRRVVRNQSVN